MTILYHTDTCPICRGIELQLKRNNIEYTSIKDENVLREKGIMHPPALEVDGKLLLGKDIIDWIKMR